MKKYINYFILPIIFLFVSCSGSKIPSSAIITFDKTEREISFPTPTTELKERYNKTITGDSISIRKGDKEFSGFVTSNKVFLEEVITPVIEKHIDELKIKQPAEIINSLAIFGFELYQTYFGKSFYRWGGDIFDLDDPQDEGSGHRYKYGLDCSGYASLPFDLAVHFNLVDAKDALFSSKGYELYCKESGFEDRGGREGTPNNFRLDTRDMFLIGKEIFRVEGGSSPTEEQMKMLQPGDIVGRSGHVGIIVEMNNKLYFLESGGRVVPNAGGNPVEAKTALELFAERRFVSVRRGLPDLNK